MLRVTMTPVRRKRLLSILTFGTLLTLLVLGADWGGWLVDFEQFLYDVRVRFCQRYAKPATDKLVHVDIDDGALKQVGQWPWPRSRIAAIIEELNRASAKAIVLDILFSEAERRDDEPGGGPNQIDNDAILADAIRRAGNVVLAASPTLAPPVSRDAVAAAMLEEVRKDVGMTKEELSSRLAARSASEPALAGFETRVESELPAVRLRAMAQRISETLDKQDVSLEELTAQLLPTTPAGPRPRRGAHVQQLAEAFNLVTGARAIGKFTAPPPPDPPVLIVADPQGGQLPMPQFAAAASHTAFVSYVRSPDGIVRCIPLAVWYDGRILPQIDLTAACIAMGADVRDVRFGRDEVIIPRPGGDVRIPTRAYREGPFTGTETFFDIPTFGKTASGTKPWETMYDVPRHEQPKARLGVLQVIAAIETRRKMARNTDVAILAARRILNVLDPGQAEDFEAAAAAGISPDVMRTRAGEIADELQFQTQQLRKLLDASTEERERLDALSRLQREQKLLQDYMREDSGQPILAKLREQVEGRVVFVGSVATGGDIVPNSIDPACPGVYVHGAAFNAIMTGEFWRTAPHWVDLLLTAGMGLLTTLAVAALNPPRAFAATLFLSGVYAALNGLLLFDKHNLIVCAAGPLVAASVVWAGVTLIQFVREIGERARLTRRFSSYVDPTLVNYVIENPEQARLEARETELTVVFTDLQGFTTLSEKLGPQSAKMLGQYMEAMVPLIRARRGYVNKFLGDGIMCFFGAPRPNPDHAADAIAAVLEMQQAIVPFNDRLKADGLPTLLMRAGVSTGMMVVGDAGPSFASDYTVLGDAVNLAARLEGANKPFGTSNLITARTAELIKDRFLTRPIANLLVVGKAQCAMVYEAIAPLELATPEQRRLAELTAAMFDAFAAQKCEDCDRALAELERVFGASKLTARYAEELAARRGKPFEPGYKGEIQLFAK